MDIDEFDAQFERIIELCADGEHELNEAESRIIAAAYAQTETALERWGNGEAVTDFRELADDAQFFVDSVAIVREPWDPHAYREGARNVINAMHDYFVARANASDSVHTAHGPGAGYDCDACEDAMPKRDEYAQEFEYLASVGCVNPRIMGVGGGCTAIKAELDGYEVLATNADYGVIVPRDGRAETWNVSIYSEDGHPVAEGGPSSTLAAAYSGIRFARD